MTTYDSFFSANPRQKDIYEKEFNEFLISEFILEQMQNQNVSIRELAKKSNVSPTVIQKLRSRDSKKVNLTTFISVIRNLGYQVKIEKLPLHGKEEFSNMNEFENYEPYFNWNLENSTVDGMGKTAIYNTSFNNKTKNIPIKVFIRYYNDTSTINSDAMYSVFIECDKDDITDTVMKIISHDIMHIIFQNRESEFVHKNGQIPPEVHFVIHIVDKIPDVNDTWFSIYCN